MIFLHSHGRVAIPDGCEDHYCDSETTMTAWAACGHTSAARFARPTFAPFGYYFADAPEIRPRGDMTAGLDALAEAMVEPSIVPEGDSEIAPVFTYFGQFIDHDITANMDREAGLSLINASMIEPLPRTRVSHGLGNLRAGSLNLDSLYGDGTPNQGAFGHTLCAALRFPKDRAKLWAGTLATVEGHIPPVQQAATERGDLAWDLLRLGRTMAGANPIVTEAELRALPLALRKLFFHPADERTGAGEGEGALNLSRAIIADARNDENLAIAQLHLAMIRFHNSVVDEAPNHGADVTDREAVYRWAQTMVRWHYQWLVVSVYLPAVCDPNVVAEVLRAGAPVYTRFVQSNPPPQPGLLPLPLEFSAAAFRFGHSMVRHSYDWNRFFGRPVAGWPHRADRAAFDRLFAFTGEGRPPMAGVSQSLPSLWPIEWDRFLDPVDPDMADRSARRIDTLLAPPLSKMANRADTAGILAFLGKRNLRRGYRLNLPSAQSCLAALEDTHGIHLPVLTRGQIANEATASVLMKADLLDHTPLWYYVLREAEVLGQNGRLGPLGSRLVAETLAGLILCDRTTYWHQEGANGRWRPQDGVKPRGAVVDCMRGLMEAAGTL